MPETFLSYREVPGLGRQEFVAGLEKVKHDRCGSMDGLVALHVGSCAGMAHTQVCVACSFLSTPCCHRSSVRRYWFCQQMRIPGLSLQARVAVRHLRPDRRRGDGVPAARRLPHQLPRPLRPQHRPLSE